MMNEWTGCKNILCIRADNLGDLLMSSPAVRALKETFDAKLTVLTSSMAAGIVGLIPEIDDVLVANFPWVKADLSVESELLLELVNALKNRNFDSVVIFTVYSQNPLPAAMLAYMAGIPLRLAYCRENPYGLLTNWLPDEEPFAYIKHQVQRDLDLVASVGAHTADQKLYLQSSAESWSNVQKKLARAGINTAERWLVLHAGVSEEKRQYPEELWVEIAKRLIAEMNVQVLFTGSASEEPLTKKLQQQTGKGSFSFGGALNLEEFVSLIGYAPLVISVNTGTIHITAALNVPMIVLYALSNPQHSPWKAYGKVFPFSISGEKQSRNQVIQYVNSRYFNRHMPYPTPEEIVAEAYLILEGKREPMPELIIPG